MIEKHPYSIWKGKEGLWHTYLPDAEKKRIHKRSSTRQGIEDIVADYWKEQMENPTVKDVYEQVDHRETFQRRNICCHQKQI